MRPVPARSLLHILGLIACPFVMASALVAQQSPRLVTQPVDKSVRTILKGNIHPLARSEFDQGEVPESMSLQRMLLVLKRSEQQEAALRRFIEEQQDKTSANYHQWLTPQEFGLRFGPADSDLAAVVTWLQSEGFDVTSVSNGRTIIEFNGTAGQIKHAFGTALHKYDIRGEAHLANSSDPSIPTALALAVAGVRSLTDFRAKAQSHFVGTYSQETKQVTPAPQFNFSYRGNTYYTVSPYDFATIYDLLPLWTAPTPINGTGQTIAIVSRSNIDPTDATRFWTLFGLGQNGVPIPTLKIIPNGPDPGLSWDEAEADIDVQWSGAAAPGATIDLVVSLSALTDGVDLSAIYIVDNNLAPVMSTSYGLCEYSMGAAGVTFYGQLWEQAAAQGISAMVSSGDSGSAGCDFVAPAEYGLNVNGFASTPFNAAVGGTDFNQHGKWSTYWNSTNNATTQQSAKGYIPETAWNDSCTNALFQPQYGGNAEAVCNNPNLATAVAVGGGGGASAAWLKPTWQTGAGVPNDNARDLPDISLFASNGFVDSFYVICQKDANPAGICDLNNLAGYGGTSVASPAFAGIMALVNQKWGPQGVPGLTLYNLITKQADAFHDVPSGSTIRMPCFTGKPDSVQCVTNVQGDAFGVLSGHDTGTGYDLATGLGSVDAANLVNNWNKVSFTPSTTELVLNNGSPVNLTHGTPLTVTATVTPASSPIPTGDVALLVNPGKPGNPGIDFASLGANSNVASWTDTVLPGGNYGVIAHYTGDTTYGGSYSNVVNVTVNPENSSVYMPGVYVCGSGGWIYSTSITYGSCYILRAEALNSAGQSCSQQVSRGVVACPTGTISFTDNGNTLDASPYTLNSEGYVEDRAISLTVGSHTLAGSYSGDQSYNPSSTSPGTVVTVAKAPTSITDVAASPAAAVPSESFTMTATVGTHSNALAPTGAVTFLINGSPVSGTIQYPPSPSEFCFWFRCLRASQSTSLSTVGTYTITAQYSGDTNYLGVTTSNSYPMIIGDFSVPAALSDPPAANPGQSTSTTMQVLPLPAGSTFAAPVTYACSIPGQATGVWCSFTPTSISAGASQTNVQITAGTRGPGTGAAGSALQQLRGQSRWPWLPPSLPLAAVALVGIFGRRMSRRYKIAGLFLALALAATLMACGGGSSSSSPPPPPPTPAGTYPITVTVTEDGTLIHTTSFNLKVN